MYHKHHRGMVNRHKIRFRKYNTSDIVFLEVKLKDSRGVTTKNRMKAENGENVIQSTGHQRDAGTVQIYCHCHPQRDGGLSLSASF